MKRPWLYCLCLVVLGAVVARAGPGRPNVVLIFADDMGYGDVSAYDPASKIKTPNIDRLVSQGMQFDVRLDLLRHESMSRVVPVLFAGNDHLGGVEVIQRFDIEDG